MNDYNREDIIGIIQKLKRIAETGLRKNDTEQALEATAACAKIQYFWLQQFTDEELEKIVRKIAEKCPGSKYEAESNTVLFYDEPGFDLRALGIVYLKGLAMAGFRVVFITRSESKDKQPILHKALQDYDIIYEYYPMNASYSSQVRNLSSLILKYKPFAVLAHSSAFDPVWPTVFSAFSGCFERYVVNLTDHGFWLGKDSIDYVLEFRDFGASISLDHRKLPLSKLIKLPYYPYIDKAIEFQGLPFDENSRFIFTGGSLYKTLSEDHKYYRMVGTLLEEFPDLKYLYAGYGDDTDLRAMSDQFPGRVFHIKERTDLYQIMKRCTFYMNSYPVVGGLMTQYAAASGKLPLTLNHAGRANGMLIDDERAGVFFTDSEKLMNEARRLLSDEAYLAQRSQEIEQEVLTPEQFSQELRSALTQHTTSYQITHLSLNVESLHKEHAYMFNESNLYLAITQKRHKKLVRYFPLLFIKKAMNKIRKKKK